MDRSLPNQHAPPDMQWHRLAGHPARCAGAEEVRLGFDRRRPGARRNVKPGPQTSELIAKGHQRTAVQYAKGVQVTFVRLHFTDDLVLVGRVMVMPKCSGMPVRAAAP
jgi:hypothetical protein